MTRSLNIALTDELRAFVDQHSGDGSLYATPSEFVRAVLREKKERQDAAVLRSGVLEGYQDLHAGRLVEYTGDLRKLLGTKPHRKPRRR